MFSDLSKAEKIYIACGYTGRRKSIDKLATLVQQNFQLNPFQNSLFLFCGRQHDRLKALYWEGDCFVHLYKRLEKSTFHKNAEAVRGITRQEFRWLMEELSIDQPKAVKSEIPYVLMCTPCQGQFGFLEFQSKGIYAILTVLYRKGE